MTLGFKVLSEIRDGPHLCRSCCVDGESWLAEFVDDYLALRAASVLPPAPVYVDGIEVLDVTAVQSRIKSASVPGRGSGKLGTLRSDLGEAMAACLFSASYGTEFVYLTVRDRETVNLPGRGIDGIGLERPDSEGRLVLVLLEAKVSDQDKSPPDVVEQGNDSIRSRHLKLVGSSRATADVLWDVSRRVRDASLRGVLTSAAYSLEHDPRRLSVISAGFMVRPEELHAVSDFARYRTSPGDFAPAIVRFEIVCVPERIEPTVDALFARLSA
jgi:hypothetical protein